MLVIDHISDSSLKDGTVRRDSKMLQVLKHPAQALAESLPVGGGFAILDDHLDLLLHPRLIQH